MFGVEAKLRKRQIMKTKSFSLRTILTVTTGRLLTEGKGERDNGIGDLYEILGWMSGEYGLITHQLPRVGEKCKPWLLKQFPELTVYGLAYSMASLDKWLKSCREGHASEGIKMWLTEMKMMFPEIKDRYEVAKIQPESHERIDPISELRSMMREGAEIVPVLV